MIVADVVEPVEMNVEGQNVEGQNGGGHGVTALPDNAMAAGAKRVNIGMILFGVWGVGVVAFLATAIVCNRRMVRAACQSPETVPDWMQAMFLECRKQLNIRTWPVLIVSRSVKTPCLVGAIRPRVLVPQQLLDEENSLQTSRPSHGGEKSMIDPATAMRHVFLHELTHLKQGDIWLSWCWTLVMALHWYNPLLWWAGRLVGFDCEAACDHRVLEQLEPSRHASYGRSLLEILQKLNSPVVRSPGFSAVIEGKTNFERRLVMITNFRKRTWKQSLAAGVMLTLLLAASLTTFAREKHEPISADKAKMIGYVEDFFMNNYRDITMRKSLEWGDVVTDDQGNSTIRYKFEALIWDKDRMIDCADFTFDKDGRYVSSEKVDGYPQEKEKPDTSTTEGMQKLVEKFFSQNYRDITKRKTLEWGEPQTLENGNRSIRYKYEATIWDKDVITQEKVFTFTKDGDFVSAEKVDGHPQEKEKPDTLTVEGMKKLVEDVMKEEETPVVVDSMATKPNERVIMEGYPQEDSAELEKLMDAIFDLEIENEKIKLDSETIQRKISSLKLAQHNASGNDNSEYRRLELEMAEQMAKLDQNRGLIKINQRKKEALEIKVTLKQRQIEEKLAMWQLMQEKQQPTVSVLHQPAVTNEEDRAAYEKLVKLQEELHQAKQQLLKLDKEAFALDQAWDQERKELNQKLESVEESEREKLMGEFQKRHAEGIWEMTQKQTVIIQQIQEIELQLEHEKAVMQLKRDFGPGSGSRRQNERLRAPTPQTPAAVKKSDADREKAAEDFLDLVSTEKYDEACQLMTPLMQNAMPVEKLQQLFDSLQQTMGKVEESKVSRIVDEQGFRVTYATVTLEKADLTLKIAVDDEANIAGFYIVGVLPRFGETEEIIPFSLQLGEFIVTENDHSMSINIELSFNHENNYKEFQQLYEEKQKEVRNAILVILRSMQDYDDTRPQNMVPLIKEIKTKINEIIGKPLVDKALIKARKEDKTTETPQFRNNSVDAEQYVWDKFGLRGQSVPKEEITITSKDASTYSIEGALLVEEIKPGSMFESLKIQQGDLIAGILTTDKKEGWNIMKLADLIYLAEHWTPEQISADEVQVLVVRNGKMLTGMLPITKDEQ